MTDATQHCITLSGNILPINEHTHTHEHACIRRQRNNGRKYSALRCQCSPSPSAAAAASPAHPLSRVVYVCPYVMDFIQLVSQNLFLPAWCPDPRIFRVSRSHKVLIPALFGNQQTQSPAVQLGQLSRACVYVCVRARVRALSK